jgi:PAS domain S-box-containing protein
MSINVHNVYSDWFFLGSAPARPTDRITALAVIIVCLLVSAVASTYADTPSQISIAFIAACEAPLVVIELITALLLFGQFRELRERSLLLLASGYLFTAFVVVAHALSFPGLFKAEGLIGGSLTTIWLWAFWHGLFPCFIGGYAILAQQEPQGRRAHNEHTTDSGGSSEIRRLVVLGWLLAAGLAGVCIVLTTSGHEYLPELMDRNIFRPDVARPVVAVTGATTLIALGVLLWRTRVRRIIDLWLAVMLCVWLMDIALSAFFNSGRFHVGFFVGRIYNLFATSFVLCVLLKQALNLYRELARALQAERENALRAVQAKAQVRKSEAQLQTLFNVVPLGVYLVDADFRIRQVNPTALSVLGNIPDLIGRDLSEVIHILWPQAIADETVQRFRYTLETGEAYYVPEFIEQRRDRGVVEYYEWQINRIALPDGRYGVVCHFRDITAQVLPRQAIVESEERYRGIVNQSLTGIAEADATGRFITVNGRFCKMTGYSSDELLSMRTRDVTYREDLPRSLDLLGQLSGGGTSFEIEKRFIRKDHSLIWVHNSVAAVRDTSGKLRSFIIVSIDISERKRAEEALRESEERYRTLFNSIDEGFVVAEVLFDETGKAVDQRFLEANPAFEKQCGFLNSVGKTALDFLPNLEDSWLEIIGNVAKTGEPIRKEDYVTAMDAWFDNYVFRLGEPESHKVAVLFTNITERKRAEEALHHAAEINAFRVRLGDTLRPLSDPVEVQVEAARILGTYLKANRVVYGEVLPNDQDIVIASCYVDGVSELAGPFHLDDYGPSLVDYVRTGRTFALEDVENSLELTDEEKAAYRTIEVASYLCVPLVKGGRLVSTLGITQTTVRHWTAIEFALAEETAERAWAAVESARAKAAQHQLSAELEWQARRFDAIASTAKDAICTFDPLGRITYANKALLDILKRTPEQTYHKPLVEVGFAFEEATKITRQVEQVVITRQPLRDESVILNVAPNDISYEYILTPVINSLGATVAVAGILRDTTERKRFEEQLRQSEAKYRTLFDSMDEGFLLADVSLDEDGRTAGIFCVEANPAALRMIGRDITGRRFSEVGPAFESYWSETFSYVARTSEGVRVERYAQSLDAWFDFYVFKPRVAASQRVAVIFKDVSERKQAEAALKRASNVLESRVQQRTAALHESETRLRALSAHLESVREEHSAKIAREVHDELGGVLTVLRLGLSLLETHLGDAQKTREKITSLVTLTQGAITRVRTISTSLRPAMLDQLGLIPTLKCHLKEFSTLTGIEHELSLPDYVRLSPERSTGVFRIIQEALTNVARHADATNVKVQIRKYQGQLLVEVRDNGKGIVQAELRASKSFGIFGMHERSLFLSGELTIRGAKGGGTALVLNLPLDGSD